MRSGLKKIVSLGVLPKDQKVVHKNFIDKVMGISLVGYAVTNGDWGQGGKPVKLAFTRCARRVQALKLSRKRRYLDDGSGKWKCDGPIIRKKGDLWLKDCEVKATDEGTNAHPKFSLRKWWLETAFPAIEKAIHDQFPGYRVPISGDDNAGPHVKKDLIALLNLECNRRGWFFAHQPRQTPIWNVNDRCLFPALSKRMDHSSLRWLDGKQRVLKRDEVWRVAKHTWDHYPLDTLARSFAMQPYIVKSIQNDNGSNKWMRVPGGLHFGIRKTFVWDSQTGKLKLRPRQDFLTAFAKMTLNM